MKYTKKLFAALLTLVLTLAMAMPVGAAAPTPESGNSTTKGTITIDNAVSGQTYKIYRIFDLESFSTTGTDVDKDNTADTDGAYSYKVNDDWKGFVKEDGNGAGNTYVEVSTTGYVTWKTTADVKTFAAAAIAYADDNSVIANETKTADSASVTFNELPLGYYLVSSTTGALCSLDTTNKDVIIKDKNEAPSVDKKIVVPVAEDTTDGTADGLVVSNTATIGDTVNYQITITAQPGAENYVLHDTMGTGLAFSVDTANIAVKVGTTTLTENTDYTVVTENLDDDCTFHIELENTYMENLDQTTSTDIVITYSATVNAGIIDDAATNVGKNIVLLKYGADTQNPMETAVSTVTTFSYSFGLMKTKSDDTLLTGAKFKLYGSENGTDEIKVVKIAGQENAYRVATAAETGVEIEAGKVTIDGLGNGTYYLEETEAPAGYNKLADRVSVKIENADNPVSTVDGNDDTYDTTKGGGVQVVNNTGTELPETGGMGTTIFYIVGGVLMVVALVLLVTRKRMSDRQ